MKRLRYYILIFLLCLFGGAGWAQTGDLQRATPEQVGLTSKLVTQMMDSLMAQTDTDIHGIMVMRYGKVIAEKYNSPWSAPYGHTLYSCSKTFTAVAVGLCVADSLLTLETPLAEVLPDMLPETASDSLRLITVKDLLTMRSGLPVDTYMRTKEREWVRAYLMKQMVALPGELYAYDSIDSYLLAAMVQRVSGKKMMQLLQERVFRPMHITQAYWEESPEGITCAGWGLYLQLESMAKFGQLLVQQGAWGNKQLVPAEWIEQMMTPYVDRPDGSKYGLHIWQDIYPGMWRADGAYGQYIYVLPEKEMVIAITQCMRGNRNVESMWVNRLARAAGAQSLPVDQIGQKMLAERKYSMPLTKGKETSPQFVIPFSMDIASNDLGWRRLDIYPDKHQLRVKVTTMTGRTFEMLCGYQQWLLSSIEGMPLNYRAFKNNFSNIPEPFLVSSSYGWTSPTDLYLRLNFVNWLSSCRLHLNLKRGQIGADILMSHQKKAVKITGYLK